MSYLSLVLLVADIVSPTSSPNKQISAVTLGFTCFPNFGVVVWPEISVSSLVKSKKAFGFQVFLVAMGMVASKPFLLMEAETQK